jgi:hypothetical protein
LIRVRLTQIDGKLPNLALMKLSAFHRARGDDTVLTRELEPAATEGEFDTVYASSIFTFSKQRLERFLSAFPQAIIGGTGTESLRTVEDTIIGSEYERYDYTLYPEFPFSIGFTQRGCRLSCKFCVVPKKEGKPRSVNTIYDIWQHEREKKIMLLDNDFFGQSKDALAARVTEIIDGKFKVCFNQGINVRLIDDEAAYWLARIKYYDDSFMSRRLYTAWDNLRDEKIFFDGVERLAKAGVPSRHLMAYMLIGYDPTEDWERIMYRFNKMVELDIKPYPMVFNNKRLDLKRFQKWVVRRYYKVVSWEEFKKSYKSQDVFENPVSA